MTWALEGVLVARWDPCRDLGREPVTGEWTVIPCGEALLPRLTAEAQGGIEAPLCSLRTGRGFLHHLVNARGLSGVSKGRSVSIWPPFWPPLGQLPFAPPPSPRTHWALLHFLESLYSKIIFLSEA